MLLDHLKDEMRVQNVIFLATPPAPAAMAKIECSDHACLIHFALTVYLDQCATVTAEGSAQEMPRKEP